VEGGSGGAAKSYNMGNGPRWKRDYSEEYVAAQNSYKGYSAHNVLKKENQRTGDRRGGRGGGAVVQKGQLQNIWWPGGNSMK